MLYSMSCVLWDRENGDFCTEFERGEERRGEENRKRCNGMSVRNDNLRMR